MKTVQAMLAEADAQVPRISPDDTKGLVGLADVLFLVEREPGEVATSGKMPGRSPCCAASWSSAPILDGAHPLKALREHRGLTQAELAQTCATSAVYISQIERGARRAGRKLLGKVSARRCRSRQGR